MLRVAGADPGTSSLDLIVLADGSVAAQCRFLPEQLQAEPELPVRWLRDQCPLDLIAGPSGYGLPLARAADCGEREWRLMSLVRPDERGEGQGVVKFSRLVRLLSGSGLPVVFLPGVIHLPTVPVHRKINRIDLGTADKLCVAALALSQQADRWWRNFDECSFCVIELGSAFTACVVVYQGRIVDGLGGTSGPVGWGSGGAWDGEVAYLFSPLAKRDLFAGGVTSQSNAAEGELSFRESLVKTVAGLQAVTPVPQLILSGRLLETQPALSAWVEADLSCLGAISRLEALPGAWVKHAAQGAALLADGLAGGSQADLVERLQLRQAAGTVLDWIHHPRAAEVRAAVM